MRFRALFSVFLLFPAVFALSSWSQDATFGDEGTVVPPDFDYAPQMELALLEYADTMERSLALSEGTLTAIYNANNYQPLWYTPDGWRDDARGVLNIIADADAHGLDPQDYNILNGKIVGDNNYPIDEPMVYDLALTTMLSKYAHVMDQGLYPQKASVAPSEVIIDQGALQAENRALWLEGIMPRSLAYQRLQTVLAQVRSDTENTARLHMPEGPLLRPGDQHPDVEILRGIMMQTGNLLRENDHNHQVVDIADGDILVAAGAFDVYDDTLVNAVRQFQTDNGLTADGVIGNQTRSVINEGPNRLLSLIKVNLERLRWEENIDSEKWIRVNIPAYQLTGYDQGHSAINMPVIVGRSSRPTPVMSDQVTNLKFAPDWTIPNRIAREDYAPLLHKDPGYATRSGLQIYYNGRVIAPDIVNWRNMAMVSAMTLRKPPGGGGPLGGVRFSLTNDKAIFLHDTNLPHLFSRSQRDLSSGCVRVSDAEGLAAFILDNDVSDDEIKQRMNASDTSWEKLGEPVRVYLSYMTVWVDESGNIRQAKDIYGLDDNMLSRFQG